MDVLAAIRSAIARHDLIPRGETVVAGVSGGPDSLCLLHCLMGLRAEFEFELHVAHLNHQLRGAEADDDAAFVRDLAAQWGLACTVGEQDVAALARRRKLSIEEAARQARYAFLAEVAKANGSHTLAVAHNADDQTESVLMHFLRGSGTAGLRGMLPISNLHSLTLPAKIEESRLNLVRPLLAVPRLAIEAYCREYGLQPRFDRSNLDTTLFRNRLRHELLPILETYNPNIRRVLQRTADVIAAEAELLHDATQRAWRQTVTAEQPDAITLRLSAWRDLPLALQRATLREAIRRLRPSLRNVNFVHIDEAVTGLRNAATGARLSLPQRLALNVDYETFTIADARREPPLPDWPLLEPGQRLPVRAPGMTRLPDSDWWLEALHVDAWSDEVFANTDSWTAYLDAATVDSDLAMRTRAPGDRFHPQGMPSLLRLSNWMINVKIPQHARDRLPLIVAAEHIAWVAGHRIGHPFRVTTGTRRVLRLSFHR